MTVAEQHDMPMHLPGSSAAFGDPPFGAVGRTATFWRRASRIYFGYKSAQTRAALLGHPEKYVKDDFWRKHHTWAGAEMYSLAVDLRGFYLKVNVTMHSAAWNFSHLCVSGGQALTHPSGWTVPWSSR